MKTAQTSWKHIRRSPYQALAAVFIMMLTFLAISIFSFIVIGSNVVIKYFESKPQVTAFFKNEATQDSINQIQTDLQKTGKVSGLRFISKKEAVQIYKKQNSNDPLLLDLVSEDILPASLEVSTYNIFDLNALSVMLHRSPIVSEVVYQRDIVSMLSKWTDAIRLLGVILIIILAVVSIFIMMTVIGFKVSQKKEEIEIMRLLSATGWYIRWPFIFEGIFYGIAGTVLGWIVASLGLIYMTPYLQSFLKGIPLLPVSPVFLFELLLTELVIAVILGIIASSLAVLRYLK